MVLFCFKTLCTVFALKINWNWRNYRNNNKSICCILMAKLKCCIQIWRKSKKRKYDRRNFFSTIYRRSRKYVANFDGKSVKTDVFLLLKYKKFMDIWVDQMKSKFKKPSKNILKSWKNGIQKMTIKLHSKSRTLYDHFAYFRNSWNLFEYIFHFTLKVSIWTSFRSKMCFKRLMSKSYSYRHCKNESM